MHNGDDDNYDDDGDDDNNNNNSNNNNINKQILKHNKFSCTCFIWGVRLALSR